MVSTNNKKLAKYTIEVTFKHIDSQKEEFKKKFKSKLEDIIKLAEANEVSVSADEFSEITPELTEAVKQYFETPIYMVGLKNHLNLED